MKLKSSLKYSRSLQKGILHTISISIKGKKIQTRTNLMFVCFFFLIKIMSWLIYEESRDLFEELMLQYLCWCKVLLKLSQVVIEHKENRLVGKAAFSIFLCFP